MVLSGNAKGSKKEEYELELFVPQSEKELNSDGWTGTCTCENSSKNEKVCSHQVALILEWDDQRKLKEGIITKSDKTIFKKSTTVEKTFTKQQLAKYNKHKKDLENHKVDTLKKMLKLNDQVSTGNKGDLITRVAVCQVLGVVPRCPECAGGHPKFKSGFYYCPGYMDDTKFQRCDWISRDIDLIPWKHEDEE